MRFHDAHNHLQDERFAGRQADLVAACREAGVGRMVVNGSCEEDWPAVAELAARYPEVVIPAFGLHPWYVHERTPAWRPSLERFLDGTPGATVGEIGIDRWILECPPAARAGVSPGWATHQAASLDEQEEVFREQLALAAVRDVPASIHCLQAWGRMHDLLRASPRPARGFLLHSYGGSAELVAPLARLGARFGFPGYFLHARKARQREAFRVVPADRLLVETDAPDQRLPADSELAALARAEGGGAEAWDGTPCVGTDGRPLNHPANLPLVYRGLALHLREPVGPLAERVAANFEALFGR
jgi:TatD DNase family protein